MGEVLTSLHSFLRRYLSRATGLLAGTGVGRTTRKADNAAGFHPATRRTFAFGGEVENTYDSILAALRPLVTDDASAAEVYSALHEIAWVAINSPAQSYSEAFDLMLEQEEPCFYWTWRGAGDFIAEARGKGESYIDVYAELPIQSGVVSERVRRLMASLGLRPVR